MDQRLLEFVVEVAQALGDAEREAVAEIFPGACVGCFRLDDFACLILELRFEECLERSECRGILEWEGAPRQRT